LEKKLNRSVAGVRSKRKVNGASELSLRKGKAVIAGRKTEKGGAVAMLVVSKKRSTGDRLI